MPSDRRAPIRAATALLAALLVAPPARAEPPPSEPRAAAERLFDRGLALLDAGDHEGALDLFLRSRALVPGKGNTANAARCLHLLGRLDEALGLYEELVTRYAAELSPENRRRLAPAMAELRARLGSVSLSANVRGTVIVDGRARGTLPLAGPVRVVAGRRRIRVLADGYAPFERVVDVAAGAEVAVDAVLEPLAQAGRLRLEDPEAPGAAVFVGGVGVGSLPWEGTLGPGEHLVWATGDDRGSAPARAIVVQGQAATLRLRSGPLGPTVTLAVEPATAELRLDGIPLGSGSWSGRLPVGAHEVAAAEPGYHPGSARFDEPMADGAPVRVRLTLDVDRAHPRWPSRPRGQVELQAFGGLGLGTTFGADAERACGAGCSGGPVLGGLGGARAGFRFPFGLSLELSAGWLSLGKSFTRSLASSFRSAGATHAVTYELHDELRTRGPFVGAGAGLRVPLGARFGLVSRATVGVWIASSGDPISGRARTAVGSAPVSVSDRFTRVGSTPVFVLPELGLDARLGALDLGASLGLAAVLGQGPALGHASLGVDALGCSSASPAAPACATVSDLVAGERAYRPFAVLVPTLWAGTRF